MWITAAGLLPDPVHLQRQPGHGLRRLFPRQRHRADPVLPHGASADLRPSVHAGADPGGAAGGGDAAAAAALCPGERGPAGQQQLHDRLVLTPRLPTLLPALQHHLLEPLLLIHRGQGGPWRTWSFLLSSRDGIINLFCFTGPDESWSGEQRDSSFCASSDSFSLC